MHMSVQVRANGVLDAPLLTSIIYQPGETMP